MIKEFRLPDLGEGLTESEIVAWKVAVGDTVALNQIIAEVETAKAVVELPSPFAGVVAALHEQPGTVVEVGKPIVSFEVEGDDGGPAGGPGTAGGAADAPAKREPNLVGYGAVLENSGRPARRARSFAAPAVSAAAPAPAGRTGGARACSGGPSRPRADAGRAAVRGTPAVHAAGAQAGQGSRRRPRGRHRHRGVWAHHPRRRPQLRRRGRPAGGTPGPGRRVRASLRRRASGKPGHRSRACGSSPPPPWSPAPSPRRTSRNS